MGQRLLDYRRARRLKLRDLHDRTGIAMSYISRLEREGDWTGVSIGRLARIARALDVAPGDLLGPDYLWPADLEPMRERKRGRPRKPRQNGETAA